MALTAEGAQLTAGHRQVQHHINVATLRDLLQLWRVVDPKNLRHTIGPFTQAAGVIVLHGRRLSAAASARYYVAFRAAEGIGHVAAPTLAAAPPAAAVADALRGAALSGIVNGFHRGLAPDAQAANGYVKLSGSASSLVLGGGRETVLGAVQGDDAATGYQRVASAGCCAFCAMIASQGIIAKDADSAGFEAHNLCGCGAEPAFEGSPVNASNAKFREAWDAATDGLSGGDALNAFRRSMASPE